MGKKKVRPVKYGWCGKIYYFCKNCGKFIKKNQKRCSVCDKKINWKKMKISKPIPGDLCI